LVNSNTPLFDSLGHVDGGFWSKKEANEEAVAELILWVSK